MSHRPPLKMNFSSWAIANQQLVVFFMLLIMAIGVKSYEMLSRNEDPNFTIKTAVVSAQWPGASIQDTLNFVTDPLEKKLQEIPWLDYVESETRGGRTVIFVNLRDDTPPSKVSDIWYQLRKKMQDIAPTLPTDATGPWVNDEFDDTFGTIYAFTRDGFSARALRDRVETIRRDLMSLPDIGKIQLLGEQEEQVVIAFSPQKMAGLGVTLEQITAALQAQNAIAPSGTARTDKENIALRVSGAFSSEESLKSVTLHVDDRYIPLTDIATLSREVAEPPTPLFRVNGQPAIGLAVSMAATGNMLRFGQALNARMENIRSTLPHGIEMTRVADQSHVVEHAVDEFVQVLIEAIIIVMAVSFVSLGLRAGLVVAAAIPLVLALTFTLMLASGIGLQRISLGALIIALGLLVDDAMITVEAMVGRLEAGESKIKAASYAFGTTAFPMLTGTLVMIAGFIPVGFATSSAGEYCFTLFAVVLIALICSWVVAVVFSPLTGVWILPQVQKMHNPPPSRIKRGYIRLLNAVMRRRGLTLAVALLLLTLSGAATLLLQGGFFPPSDRPELLVNLTLPGNASQTETARQTERLEKALLGNPNMARFSSYIGSGAIRFYLPMDVALENENIAQLVVVAKDLPSRNRLQQQISDILSQQFSDIVARVYPLELGPPVGWPVKYRVSGPDYAKVQQFAQTLATQIAHNPDTREVNVSAGEPERVITLKVNQTAARAAGIPLEPAAALALLNQPAQAIDLGQVGEQLFLNMATGGFGSQVTASTSEDLKKVLGAAAYLFTGLSRFSELQAASVELQGPDFHWQGDLLALGIGNGRQAGGGQVLCPEAVVNDGLLDIAILPAPTEVVGALRDLFGGEGLFIRARLPWVEVKSSQGLDINLDGEPLKADSLRFAAKPATLRLHLPSASPLLSHPG